MINNHSLLDIDANLKVKLLVLAVYDEVSEEIKRMDTLGYLHSENPVNTDLLINLRNVFFVIGNRDKFKELNSEIYGYHESHILPEYRHIAVYQEQSEHATVPDGRHSLHPKENYVKIQEFTCHLPIGKIYEKSKEEHSRKEVQKEIYHNVLSSAHDYLWYIMEEYFGKEVDSNVNE